LIEWLFVIFLYLFSFTNCISVLLLVFFQLISYVLRYFLLWFDFDDWFEFDFIKWFRMTGIGTADTTAGICVWLVIGFGFWVKSNELFATYFHLFIVHIPWRNYVFLFSYWLLFETPMNPVSFPECHSIFVYLAISIRCLFIRCAYISSMLETELLLILHYVFCIGSSWTSNWYILCDFVVFVNSVFDLFLSTNITHYLLKGIYIITVNH
jgi:hypothetical protein